MVARIVFSELVESGLTVKGELLLRRGKKKRASRAQRRWQREELQQSSKQQAEEIKEKGREGSSRKVGESNR